MGNFEQRAGREKQQHPAVMLKNILGSQSEQTNKAVESKYSLGVLLKRDAALDPEGYAELYGKEAIKADANFVRERELEFSGANIPNVQAFYRSEHGAKTEDEVITKWRENKSREKNGQMEMAITALLSQKLGKDFIVVRTAPYDDYKNGVDNLILDCVTGEIVGAFDEVHEGGDGRRTEEKKSKIQKVAKKGGAEIRYGLKLVDGKLTRASLKGVPVFYLGLESTELVELVKGLGENNAQKTNEIFEKLLASLAIQHTELKKSASTPDFNKRLESFGQSLSRLTNTIESKAV